MKPSLRFLAFVLIAWARFARPHLDRSPPPNSSESTERSQTAAGRCDQLFPAIDPVRQAAPEAIPVYVGIPAQSLSVPVLYSAQVSPLPPDRTG
jgi:hypothetical protein